MGSKFLLLLLSTVAVVATPNLAYSQGLPPVPLDQEQPQSGLDPQQEALLSGLDLNDQQRQQFQAIQSLLQAQTKGILTPVQMQQVEQMKATGQKPELSQLNLSSKQMSQLQEAQNLASYRFAMLLTPEQQKKLVKLLKK